MQPADKEVLTITSSWLQEEAVASFGRELTTKELAHAEELIQDNLWFFIHDRIDEAIKYSELLKRNEGAEHCP